MENLTEARCECGHLKIHHVNNWLDRGPHCMACFTANPWHDFVLAHARAKQLIQEHDFGGEGEY